MKKKSLLLILISIMELSGCGKPRGSKEPHEHVFGEWATILAPTCVNKGIMTRTCISCGKNKSKTISPDPEAHKWIDDTNSNVDPTCTECGVEKSKICEYCGLHKEGNLVEKLDHSFNYMDPQPDEYKDPSCTSEGKYFVKCSGCGIMESRVSEPIDHEYTFSKKEGIITKVGCSNCDFCAYDFDIVDADGWNEIKTYNASNSSVNSSTWNIEGKIPANTYDVYLSAKVDLHSNLDKKYYNMANPLFASEEDIEINNASLKKDKADEDDYRCTFKVNDHEYFPQTKEKFSSLGFVDEELQGSSFFYCKFVDNITINNDSKTISLCYGNLSGASLIYKTIRLVSHIDASPIE